MVLTLLCHPHDEIRSVPVRGSQRDLLPPLSRPCNNRFVRGRIGIVREDRHANEPGKPVVLAAALALDQPADSVPASLIRGLDQQRLEVGLLQGGDRLEDVAFQLRARGQGGAEHIARQRRPVRTRLEDCRVTLIGEGDWIAPSGVRLRTVMYTLLRSDKFRTSRREKSPGLSWIVLPIGLTSSRIPRILFTFPVAVTSTFSGTSRMSTFTIRPGSSFFMFMINFHFHCSVRKVRRFFGVSGSAGLKPRTLPAFISTMIRPASSPFPWGLGLGSEGRIRASYLSGFTSFVEITLSFSTSSRTGPAIPVKSVFRTLSP